MKEYITVKELDERRAKGEKIETNLTRPKHLSKTQRKIMSQVMSKLGSMGTGKAKVRGDSAYYKRLTAIREANRKTKSTLLPPLSKPSPL